MRNNKYFKIKLFNILLTFLFIITLLPQLKVQAQEDDPTCVVYFTGIGCPHCAKSDPVLLENYLHKYPNQIVIE